MKYNDKKVAILGYGIEGKDVKKFLLGQKAKIKILDQKIDPNYLSNLDEFEIIVRSPGVYRYKKEIIEAEKKGVRITSALHIFLDQFSGTVIGVTGTKGKGTTSTLIYKILKKAGHDVYLAGNIGTPYLSLLPKLNSKSIVVLEMSSFQLIDLPVSPDIAVVLNITSDHMDWHKSQKEYIDAKLNIVKHQKPSDWAVLNKDYKVPKNFSKHTKANIIYFGKNTLDDEYKDNLKLRGEHNLENIAAAVTVAKILNIDRQVIKKEVSLFKGLEHRLELVRVINGIKFYNDSFATGPQPTIAAINSFTEPETLILGGSDKGLDYKNLGEFISKAKNVSSVLLIGEIRGQIKKEIKKRDNLKIEDLATSNMETIVKRAYEITPKGGVVILSPAAASFDMFKNYKDRGKLFKKAVKSL